ncbi:MAG: class I SAM-dependent methyltransferase [Solirubrobacterales bacterium]
MSLQGRIFAATYDRMSAKTEQAGLRALRQALLANARGSVLEIGGGTGANLPFYSEAVSALTVTEPEEPMARRLQRRLAEHDALPAELVCAPAEALPFEDGHFDTAVSTLVLCAVEDQPRALREIRRVLKPDGRLLFIEHVRAEDPRLARWQDRLTGFNHRMVGCDCNRATLDGIRSAGFTIADVAHDELKKTPPFVRPLIVGTAVAG